jgi:hypothetical protein
MGEPLSRIDLADPSGIDVILRSDPMLQFAFDKPPLNIRDVFFAEFFDRTHRCYSRAWFAKLPTRP